MNTTIENQPTVSEAFLNAYIECALFASTFYTEEGDCDGSFLDANYGVDDFSESALAEMKLQAQGFYESQSHLWEELEDYGDEQAGRDFWLSRNRHGNGFWDRGLGEIGNKLHDAAIAEGSCDLYTVEIGETGEMEINVT